MTTKTKTRKYKVGFGAHGGVKAKIKRGKVTRVSIPSVEQPAPTIGAIVGGTVATTLDAILDGLAAVGTAIWTFMGKIYDTAFAFVSAVYSWLGNAISATVGKTREALVYVKELVSSKDMDWLNFNRGVLDVLCSVAAFGIAVTAGVAVGGTIGATALSLGASLTVAKVAGVLMAASTAMVVSPMVHALALAGVDDTILAASLIKAGLVKPKAVVAA